MKRRRTQSALAALCVVNHLLSKRAHHSHDKFFFLPDTNSSENLIFFCILRCLVVNENEKIIEKLKEIKK